MASASKIGLKRKVRHRGKPRTILGKYLETDRLKDFDGWSTAPDLKACDASALPAKSISLLQPWRCEESRSWDRFDYWNLGRGKERTLENCCESVGLVKSEPLLRSGQGAERGGEEEIGILGRCVATGPGPQGLHFLRLRGSALFPSNCIYCSQDFYGFSSFFIASENCIKFFATSAEQRCQSSRQLLAHRSWGWRGQLTRLRGDRGSRLA